MTVTIPTMDVLETIRKHADDPDVDFLRTALHELLQLMMQADVRAQIGADLHEHTPDRLAYRNGYRPRRFDTRIGTLDLRIPKLRQGSYLPAFLEPRRRSEQALLAVIQQAYVEGVSTRRVEDLVQALGCDGVSKSEVSRICQALDAQVQAFRERPLDQGPYPYVWLDALTQRVREGGRVVNVAVVVATSVNGQGRREVLGLDCGASEDGAFWLSFLRALVARGLSGVQLVISDAHGGLKDAIAAVFTGASWQRCRTHFARNLLARVPKHAQPVVATLVRSIFDQPSAEHVRLQHARVVEQLTSRYPDAARMLADAREEILAFTAFPQPHWRQIRSNNPQERLNLEIRRRTDVVGIFPNRAAVIRLVGAVLAEQHDEWLVARRYLAEESLRPILADPPPSLPLQGKELEVPLEQLPVAV
jgi:transposase-like protein